MSKVAGPLALLTAVFLVASCSSDGSSGPSSSAIRQSGAAPGSSTHSQSSAPKPTTFTSKAYGYTVTVPAGWASRQAYEKWDGEWELDGTSNAVDLFGEPSVSKGVWAAAAPSQRDLAAEAAFAIVWNAHYHGDFCPHRPTTRSRVTIGGRPGVLLAYNCGILINMAVTVDHDVEYWFVFVDRGVVAANDPADHLTFLRMLRSVHFPG
jgi:hypothetical protein